MPLDLDPPINGISLYSTSYGSVLLFLRTGISRYDIKNITFEDTEFLNYLQTFYTDANIEYGSGILDSIDTDPESNFKSEEIGADLSWV